MLTTIDYINRLQRIIIVHSYLYYELDDSIISDTEYDAKARKLVEYKNDYPKLWTESMCYNQFGDDYDGSTGFSLYDKLDDGQKEIIRLIASYRK